MQAAAHRTAALFVWLISISLRSRSPHPSRPFAWQTFVLQCIESPRDAIIFLDIHCIAVEVENENPKRSQQIIFPLSIHFGLIRMDLRKQTESEKKEAVNVPSLPFRFVINSVFVLRSALIQFFLIFVHLILCTNIEPLTLRLQDCFRFFFPRRKKRNEKQRSLMNRSSLHHMLQSRFDTQKIFRAHTQTDRDSIQCVNYVMP